MKKKILFIFTIFLLTAPSQVHATNCFGTGSDGAVTISSNTNLTVPNKNGPYDGDMVVKNYSSLTINSGVTLTTDQPGRGLLIYVDGDATINGTLSMTARGAFANPSVAGASDNSAVSSTGLRLPMLKSGSTDTLGSADFAGTGTAAVAAMANQAGISGNGKIYTVARTGGAGGAEVNGATGTNMSGGGGGGGGCGGNGAAGTVFSGGSGGGGSQDCYPSGSGVAYGGAGGWSSGGNYNRPSGAGAGNPGGAASGGGMAHNNGEDGTGGLIFLIVKGNLTIGSGGSIQANGSKGGDGGWSPGNYGFGGGGGSGGGNIRVLYAGSLSNSGSVTATGGERGLGQLCSRCGFYGGAGSVVIEQVDVGITPPTAPTIGSATVLSDTSIRWNFTDNASDETGFKVYDANNVLKVTCASANLSSCTETGLTSNTQYTRKVVAYNSSGNSSYSSTATATTQTTPCRPSVSDTAHTITADCSFSDSEGHKCWWKDHLRHGSWHKHFQHLHPYGSIRSSHSQLHRSSSSWLYLSYRWLYCYR